MIALVSLLVILTLSTLVIRVATVALKLTGVSDDVARFQALSAFTGVGFTTTEAESIITHPARRRIIAIVIRLGSLGLITTVTSLLLTFVNTAGGDQLLRIGILAGALSVLGALAMSEQVNRYLERIIKRVLNRWTDLQIYDFPSMLNLTNGYQVREIVVNEDSWVANKPLRETSLRDEGLIVLGIKRDDGSYVGAPHGQTRVCPGDELIIYGQEEGLEDLDKRLEGAVGSAEHDQAVRDQVERRREQDREDTEYSG